MEDTNLPWKYYMNAFLPICHPHEQADLSVIQSGVLWRTSRRAFLARWTSDFDCGYETNWWYVIKDTPFDINAIKAKRRYDINRANRYFEVRRIQPSEYAEELYEIQVAAYSVYPDKYRPSVDKEKFKCMVLNEWGQKNVTVLGAFIRENGTLCGYAMLMRNDPVIYFHRLKVVPEYEKKGINAALVAGVMEYFQQDLENSCYICDGERNVRHETSFQDYLERTFGFRKAYCKLHLAYRPGIKCLVRVLYPFRRILARLNTIGIIHKVNGVLKMEELAIEQNKR